MTNGSKTETCFFVPVHSIQDQAANHVDSRRYALFDIVCDMASPFPELFDQAMNDYRVIAKDPTLVARALKLFNV